MFASVDDVVFQSNNLFGDSWTFLLVSIASGRRKSSRAKTEQIDTINFARRRNIRYGSHTFNHRYDENMLLRFCRVFGKAPPPCGRSFVTDPAATFRWVKAILNAISNLFGRFDPRNSDSYCSNVKHSFWSTKYCDPRQHNGIAAKSGSNMLVDFLSAQMPMFRVNLDPVHPQRNSHLCCDDFSIAMPNRGLTSLAHLSGLENGLCSVRNH